MSVDAEYLVVVPEGLAKKGEEPRGAVPRPGEESFEPTEASMLDFAMRVQGIVEELWGKQAMEEVD